MTSTKSIYRRVLRRENHAARATPAIIVAVLAILALAYLGLECVLAAASQKALLLSPSAMVGDIAGLPSLSPGLLATVGGIVALVGLVLLVIGLSSGRLARHTLHSDRAAVVVHDEMIASALARQASAAAASDPDRTTAAVGRRSAVVRVTGASGVRIDRDAVQRAVASRLSEYDLHPRLKARVRIAKEGRVGA